MKNFSLLPQGEILFPKAQQGLSLSTIKPGQLHEFKNNRSMPELFALVVEAGKTESEVIPGSYKAIMGGPNDLILSKDIMGDHISLALDLITTVPNSELTDGYAKLDDESFGKVLISIKVFHKELPKEKNDFIFALPYFGHRDERLLYHKKMKKVVDSVKKTYSNYSLHFFSLSNWAPQSNMSMRLAAGEQSKERLWILGVEGTFAEIQITYTSEDGMLGFRVYDSDENKSNFLDGYQVYFEEEGKEQALGTISSGRLMAKCPKGFDGRIGLVSPEGKACTLMEKKE